MTQDTTALSPKTLFRIVATAEAVTWAGLISGLIIRSTGNAPEWLIPVVGGAHGFTFLSYAVMAALVGVNQRWPLLRIAFGVVLAIVPFATVPFERTVAKRGYLVGSWRTEKTADPRDNGWFDSLFRWFIAKPVILMLVLIAGVVVVYNVLLVLGPPTSWFN
jgi:integral membrane protein